MKGDKVVMGGGIPSRSTRENPMSYAYIWSIFSKSCFLAIAVSDYFNLTLFQLRDIGPNGHHGVFVQLNVIMVTIQELEHAQILHPSVME